MTRLHQTTVRFDADSWARIGAYASRLGVPRAAFIRDSAQARIARAECQDEVTELRDRVDRLEQRLSLALTAARHAPALGRAGS